MSQSVESMEMTNTGTYACISRDREGSGLGTKRQVTDCRKKANERGGTIVDEYVDDDVSACSGKARPDPPRAAIGTSSRMGRRRTDQFEADIE